MKFDKLKNAKTIEELNELYTKSNSELSIQQGLNCEDIDEMCKILFGKSLHNLRRIYKKMEERFV